MTKQEIARCVSNYLANLDSERVLVTVPADLQALRACEQDSDSEE